MGIIDKRYCFTIPVKLDTTENWNKNNPILEKGEFAVEDNNNNMKLKIGNGIDNWKDLDYPIFSDIDYHSMIVDTLYSILSDRSNSLPLRTTQQVNYSEKWKEYDPILLKGEIGVEITDKKIKMKIGNGVCKWTELPYISLDDKKEHNKITNKILITAIFTIINLIISIGNLYLLLFI